MSKKVTLVLLLAIAALILSGCTPESEPPEATPVLVQEFTATSAFELLYPVNWINNLIRPGLLVFGPVEVVSLNAPGPSVTVYRISPLGAAGELDEELGQFLERGPLSEQFFLTSEVLEASLGQYAALRVEFEREAIEELNALTGYIVSARVASRAVYHFVATAPSEQWAESWPLMASVLQSVSFNE